MHCREWSLKPGAPCLILVSTMYLPGLFDSTRVEYMSDSATKIVFTCCRPSIVVSYDSEQGTHSVWSLRRVMCEVCTYILTQDETHNLEICNLCNVTHSLTHSLTQRLYPNLQPLTSSTGALFCA